MNFSKISQLDFFSNYKFEHLEKTGSTNDNLKELIKKDLSCNILQIADYQTQGRGQYGRVWESTPNQCLMFSFTDTFSINEFPASIIAGISMASALEKISDSNKDFAGLWLKWPNDLWYKNRKLAGILVESIFHSNNLKCVIGIGINVLPLNSSLDSACVKDFIKSTSRNEILNMFCLEWTKFRKLSSEKLIKIWNRYAQYSLKLKFKVLINNKEVFIGSPICINEQGALIMKDESGEIKTINAATLIPIDI